MLILSLDHLSVETLVPESGPTEADTKNISLTCIVHHDGEEARFPSAEWWTVMTLNSLRLSQMLQPQPPISPFSYSIHLMLASTHVGEKFYKGKQNS